MKRLILMGGRPWLGEDGGKNLAETLFRYFVSEVKLAFCLFAQPENEWEETQRYNKGVFEKFKGSRKLAYQVMTADNFRAVSAWADIVYIPGGEPNKLLKEIQACGDVAKLWDDKVIAGSSAGADLFCKAFIYLQDKSFGEGLGWVQAICIPHWRSPEWKDYTSADWDFAEAEALRQHPELPALCIPESKFVEFTVK